MTINEILDELRALGTEQKRKIYRRHGIGANVFGVGYPPLEKLKKRIGVNQALAEQLWATGNFEARMLAVRIADPRQMTEGQLEDWAGGLEDYVVTNYFAELVLKTPSALKLMKKWTKAKRDMVGRTGWLLLGNLALTDSELPDDFFESYLRVIEQEIHQRPNRTKDAMNAALIDIGLRNPALQKQALAVATRIGPVEVDHGETGCVTPAAAEHIKRGLKRRR